MSIYRLIGQEQNRFLRKPYPVYEFYLEKMSHYDEILKLCKELNIIKYVYTIVTRQGICLKNGGSDPETKKNPGERMYRQAGKMDGWNQIQLGKAGDDILEVIDSYHKKTGQHLNRRDVIIIVRNFTGIEETFASNDAVWQMEHELLDSYQKIFGSLPIGNIKDESHVKKKAKIDLRDWEKMFGSIEIK